MFSKLTRSISGRLALGFGILLILILALATMNAWTSHKVQQEVRQIVEVNNQRAAHARELLDNINLMTVQVRSIVLFMDQAALKVEASTLETAKAGYARAEKALMEATSQAEPSERRVAEEIAEIGTKGVAVVQKAAKAGLAGANIDATTTLTDELRPLEVQWRAKVNELIAQQARGNAELAFNVTSDIQRTTILGMAMAVAALCIGVLVAWRIARSIQGPVAHAVKVAERIAAGSLDNEIQTDKIQEVGRLLDAMGAMQARLRSLVSEIRDAALSIENASSEVAAGNIDLRAANKTSKVSACR